ncbi:MAG TPA: FecR family protein [Candidatus Binatia bacterium]|nr:FecR family protein [Candidatus Binatia bacterium]
MRLDEDPTEIGLRRKFGGTYACDQGGSAGALAFMLIAGRTRSILVAGILAGAPMAILNGVGRQALAEDAPVGSVVTVQRNCYGTPPESSQVPKYPGNTVAHNEILETLAGSAALIRFIDGSKLTIGAKSKVTLDNFVFNPEQNTGNAILNVSEGAFRFVTGAMPKGGTTIQTPTATLTLRGTEVTVRVQPNGDTLLNVISGLVDAKSNGTGQSKTVEPGHGVHVSHGGFTSGGGSDPNSQSNANDQENTDDRVVDAGFGGDTGGSNNSRNLSANTMTHTATPSDTSTPDSTAPSSGGNQGPTNAGSNHGNNAHL